MWCWGTMSCSSKGYSPYVSTSLQKKTMSHWLMSQRQSLFQVQMWLVRKTKLAQGQGLLVQQVEKWAITQDRTHANATTEPGNNIEHEFVITAHDQPIIPNCHPCSDNQHHYILSLTKSPYSMDCWISRWHYCTWCSREQTQYWICGYSPSSFQFVTVTEATCIEPGSISHVHTVLARSLAPGATWVIWKQQLP